MYEKCNVVGAQVNTTSVPPELLKRGTGFTGQKQHEVLFFCEQGGMAPL